MAVDMRYPNYDFDEYGNVTNIKFNRPVKPYISNTTGYLYVTMLHEDGKRRPTALHRILAKLFIPNPENLPQVNHIDGNKLNCSIDNLEWTNNARNIQHAYDIGLIPKLDERYNNVHPVQAIHSVCELLQEGLFNMMEISKMTGVAYKTVGQIKYRRQWLDISSIYKW